MILGIEEQNVRRDCMHCRRAGGRHPRGEVTMYLCHRGRLNHHDPETQRKLAQRENLCEGCPDFERRRVP